jgi:hypothetical protein
VAWRTATSLGKGAPPPTLVFSTASHQPLLLPLPLPRPPSLPPPQRSLRPKAPLQYALFSLTPWGWGGHIDPGSCRGTPQLSSLRLQLPFLEWCLCFVQAPAPAVHALPAPVPAAAPPTVYRVGQIIKMDVFDYKDMAAHPGLALCVKNVGVRCTVVQQDNTAFGFVGTFRVLDAARRSLGWIPHHELPRMRELADAVDRAGVEYVATFTKRDFHYVRATRRPAGHRLTIRIVMTA